MNRETSAPLRIPSQQEKTSLAVKAGRPWGARRSVVPAAAQRQTRHAHVCAAGGPRPAAEASRAQASTCHAGNERIPRAGRSPAPLATALLKALRARPAGVSQGRNPHRGLLFSGLQYLSDLRPVGKAFLLHPHQP